MTEDVSGLVERLLEKADVCRAHELDATWIEDLSEAAAAITAMSLQLAVVEGERKFITIPKTVDEAEAMQKLGFAWLEANAPERLTDLAKSLSAVQEELAANIKARNDFARECGRSWEENERLRAKIEDAMSAMNRCEHDGGFDREIGPIGCDLGDKCVCIGVYPALANHSPEVSECCGKPIHDGDPDGYVLECCGKYLSTPSPQPNLMGIETAPKDGTWFVAYQNGEPFPCDWRAEEQDEGPPREGWFDFFNRSFEDPTHWLPVWGATTEGSDNA